MGEAKRREESGLPHIKKEAELNRFDRYFLSWLPISKSRIKNYPYIGVATIYLERSYS